MDTAVIKHDIKKDLDLQKEEDQLSYEQSKEQIDLQLSEEEASTHNEENNGVASVGQRNGAAVTAPKGSTPVKLNRNNYKASLQIITTRDIPPSKQVSLLQTNNNNEIRGTEPVDTFPPQASLDINNESGLNISSRYGVSSKTRIFVGDLSWKLTEEQLKTEFDQFGTVNEVLVVKDRNSGLSKGYGFVSFEEKHAASDAIKAMNGQHIEGRPIRVEAAEERPTDDRYEKQQNQDYRRSNEYRKDIDYDRKIYYERNRKERDNNYRNDIIYRRESDHKMEKRIRDANERKEYEPRREIEHRRDVERRKGFEYDRRERDFERRIEGESKRERKQSLEPNEQIVISPKGQSNRNYMRIKDQNYMQDREYERSCDQSVMIQNDKDDQDNSQKSTQLYETDLSDKNDDSLYNRSAKYIEKEKDRNSSSRKRTRSNSINAEDAYYPRPSDIMHVDSSPPPPPPPPPPSAIISSPNRAVIPGHNSSYHRPRTPSPHFESDPSQSPWHPSSRMPKKDYYIDGQSTNYMRKRDRGREREKDRVFGREVARFLDRDRERQHPFDKEFEKIRREKLGRERDLRIMERERELGERDRQLVRTRDQPRYYEPGRDPHRLRTPHEYSRDSVRVRPPHYDYNRETDFRDKERDLVRYKDANRDSYYHHQSSSYGHLAYRDGGSKRFDDYYYQPAVYPTVRRSLSPRPRYLVKRSPSPVIRPPIPSYDRRYERDRMSRYDTIRNYEYDTRRDNYYGHHYNEMHHNEYVDHYAPAMHSNASNIKQFEENFGVGGSTSNDEACQRNRLKPRQWEMNIEKEKGTKRTQNIPTGGYERGRRERRDRRWEIIDDKADRSHNMATPVGNQERIHDRERNESHRSWDANEEKSGNVKEHDKDCADTKSTYDRQDAREMNDKYWDMDEDESREYECNSTKNRDRDKDNKERGEFDHILNRDSPISTPEFFPPLTLPVNLQSSQSISNGHQKNNHAQHAHF